MKYNPNIHHRRSIRLKGYDYSQAGLYFVTICCQNMICCFGKIKNGEMILNDAGQMVEKWCAELSHKFSDIEMDTYIIMPNHFHAIIVNNGGNDGNTVGADLRVCPDILGEHGENILGEHIGSPLHAVIQWFKTMTTNEYIRGVKMLGWQRFNKKLWQRDYWEHIIRNEQSYQHIANYIMNNPVNWGNDKFHTI
jgi:REP element-mobilizing transposase RayT